MTPAVLSCGNPQAVASYGLAATASMASMHTQCCPWSVAVFTVWQIKNVLLIVC